MQKIIHNKGRTWKLEPYLLTEIVIINFIKRTTNKIWSPIITNSKTNLTAAGDQLLKKLHPSIYFFPSSLNLKNQQKSFFSSKIAKSTIKKGKSRISPATYYEQTCTPHKIRFEKVENRNGYPPAQRGCGYQSPGHGALLRVHTEAYSHRRYPPPPAFPSLSWPRKQ